MASHQFINLNASISRSRMRCSCTTHTNVASSTTSHHLRPVLRDILWWWRRKLRRRGKQFRGGERWARGKASWLLENDFLYHVWIGRWQLIELGQLAADRVRPDGFKQTRSGQVGCANQLSERTLSCQAGNHTFPNRNHFEVHLATDLLPSAVQLTLCGLSYLSCGLIDYTIQF